MSGSLFDNDGDEMSGDRTTVSGGSCSQESDCPDLSKLHYSESTIFGPTIDETIIYLLGMILPHWWKVKLGLLAPKKGNNEKLKEEQMDKHDLENWLCCEYLNLSKEVAVACMNTRELTECPIDSTMLEARRFVLNRLAELMEKKQLVEAEYRSKRKRRSSLS